MSIFLERKSVRHYDDTYKIPRKELEEILTKTLRAPSSMNLQPTRMVVVETKAAKDKIRASLYGNHLQLDTSSAFIVLFTDLKKYDHATRIFENSVKDGFIPRDVADRQLELMKTLEKNVDLERLYKEGYIDGALLAMQLMLVAKSYGYDTCPIGGYNKDTIASAVGLDSDIYKPVLIISLGRAKEPGFDSYRLNVDDVTTFL